MHFLSQSGKNNQLIKKNSSPVSKSCTHFHCIACNYIVLLSIVWLTISLKCDLTSILLIFQQPNSTLGSLEIMSKKMS